MKILEMVVTPVVADGHFMFWFDSSRNLLIEL